MEGYTPYSFYFKLTCFFLSPFFALQTNIFEFYVRRRKGESTDFAFGPNVKVVKFVARHFLLQFASLHPEFDQTSTHLRKDGLLTKNESAGRGEKMSQQDW